MTYKFKEFNTDAILTVSNIEALKNFETAKQTNFYTFICSKSQPIDLVIDGLPKTLEPYSILALTPIQYLEYIKGEDVIIYQFNRSFYCIKDHDKEVSCVGLLFFGNTNIPIIKLSKEERKKFANLHDIFIEELETKDNIQAEMLRMLMTRFIIKTTRLLKQINNNEQTAKSSKIELLRNFNYLVETHFKTEHSVSFYANKLFKSPKTLSNNFAKLNTSPLNVIHNRIVLETKRLLMYSNKTAKEIAFEVGFEDPSHLSRLFKKATLQSPSQFRKSNTETH